MYQKRHPSENFIAHFLRRLKDFGALAPASPRALRDGGAQLLAGVYLAAAISWLH